MPIEIDGSPPPAAHLATLARVGYTFTAAVGDIIDNSIAAGATQVDIRLLRYDTDYRLSILDDGCGMSADELIDSMVIGCKDPSEERDSTDLGRFGAGLKTASFSQASKLTVFSRRDKQDVSAALWDTDLVRRKNQWCLQKLTCEEAHQEISKLDLNLAASGTLVCWDGLNDFGEGSEEEGQSLIAANLLEDLRNFIGLHFHRFLSQKLEISLNLLPVKAIDPFMQGEMGYAEGPTQKLLSKHGSVEIRAHTLPRPSTLSDETLRLHGGTTSISAGQGLYLYRNRRLISGGGWHGLARASELNNLARIQVDIESAMDQDWLTDVKKSQLTIPRKVRQVLSRIVPSPIQRSKRSHRFAGIAEEASPLWNVITNSRDGETTTIYVADTDNPELQHIADAMTPKLKMKLLSYLRDLSADLPVKHIYQSFATSPKGVQSKENVESVIDEIISRLEEEDQGGS